jgi:hypothetical protein
MCCIVASCDDANKIQINKVEVTDFMKLLINSTGDALNVSVQVFLGVLMVVLGFYNAIMH